MKICSIDGCGKKHVAKGYCKNHYYEFTKHEKGIKFNRNIEYKRSLEYFAIENNMMYLLNEFSDKNPFKPNEVSYGSDKICFWDCPDCESEYDLSVTRRTRGQNCPYCQGLRVNEANCLWATHPEIAKLLKDPQRGYEVTYGITKNEEFVCNECGYSEPKIISNVVKRGFSCPKCSDGISYPEKFMFNVLEQLGVDFEKQKTFKWSNGKKYDFYIPSLNCIIETHGGQHYTGKFSGKLLDKEFEIDVVKKDLAIEKGIENYIIIDCYHSQLSYIKNNIQNSNLSNMLNLNKIDWLKCHEYACHTLVKKACELWNNGIKNTVDIGKILKLDRSTVSIYLKQGKLMDWCDYDPKEVMKMSGAILNKKYRNKAVIQLSLDGVFIREWSSISDACKQVGLKRNSGIIFVCTGKRNKAGGFKWMYKEDYYNSLD